MDGTDNGGVIRANAMLQELATQRNALGDRAAQLAAENAVLKKRIAELEKPEADTVP